MRTPDPVAVTALLSATPDGDRTVAAGPAGRTPVPAPDSAYWSFYREVAAAQLAAWLPGTPARVLDLSGPYGFGAELVAAGHEVVLVRTRLHDAHADVPGPGRAVPAVPGPGRAVPAVPGPGRAVPAVPGPGRAVPAVADSRSLTWLGDASVDLVVAEGRALSRCLAAEVTVAQLRRVLRPGGRLLLVVDSLVSGLARLADQGRWAELADVPSADVVLVPDDDGSLLRCFWPQELADVLTGSGLDVEWVRPRSVLTPATVERALRSGGRAALRTLVRTELALAEEHEGGSAGLHLVASARRR